MDEPAGFPNGKSTSFVIYPGDHIQVTKDKAGNTRLSVAGDSLRSKELNFFAQMSQGLGTYEGYEVSVRPPAKTEQDRVAEIEKAYEQRMRFLKQQAEQSPIRPAFAAYLSASFYYKRLADLVGHYFSPWRQSKQAVPPPTAIPAVTEALEAGFRVDEDHFYLFEYRAAALNYLTYLAGKGQADVQPDVFRLFQTGVSRFSGQTRDIALFDLLKIASKDNHDSLAVMVNQFMALSTNPALRSFVSEGLATKTDLLARNRTVPNPSNQLLAVSAVQGLSWESLTDSLTQPLTYVDFWASWCGPCRAEMPNSHQLKADYSKRGVRFVYVSLDKDPAAWKRALRQVGLADAENYLLVNEYDAEIARRLKIVTIPRYVLLGRGGKLLQADASRPGDPATRQLFDKLLTMQK
ncbi:TlpA family protein disulfide reductase [Fibrella sp. WM1]|uniref:TlpA family protein disulfide reductase n=1 Tax=Fibrella musci TaxID=3242485 RepID=UPI0035214646